MARPSVFIASLKKDSTLCTTYVPNSEMMPRSQFSMKAFLGLVKEHLRVWSMHWKSSTLLFSF